MARVKTVKVGNYRAPVDTTDTGDFFGPLGENPYAPKFGKTPKMPMAPMAPIGLQSGDQEYAMAQWHRVNDARAKKGLPPLPMPGSKAQRK